MTYSTRDDRRCRRYVVSKQGHLIIHSMMSVAVEVTDLSATGAFLVTQSAEEFPENCILVVDAEQLAYPVRIVWQTGSAIGVRFTGEPRFWDCPEPE